MEIQLDFSRGKFGRKAVDALSKHARSSIKDFFRHYDGACEHVNLLAFRANSGASSSTLIKLCKAASQDFGHAPAGVPVLVFTEGTQGITCLMRIDNEDESTIRQIIERGPYNRKRNGKQEIVTESTTSGDTTVEETCSISEQFMPHFPEPIEIINGEIETDVAKPEQCETESKAPVEKVTPTRSILSPYERLVRAGFVGEEIERLKETLASIVYREVGEGEMPVAIQVPVTKITKAIIEHMKIPYNEAGNYRGKIGSFYSSRISLFGIKLDDALDPDDQYTDWLLDTSVILDFVGDKHSLAALTRKRETEVIEREREETEKRASVPPPTADTVEELVEKVVAESNDWTSSVAALDVALKMHDGRQKAEERLARARENAEAQRAIVASLAEQLDRAQTDLQTAEALVAEAEQEVDQYVLRPDVAEKLRHMKERLLELAQRFNI